jgi:DNA invertase Pin-like site-specific DNA recombinase
MAESFSPRRPRGRPPTASTQAQEIARLRAAGMRATDIADRLKICRASVYRVLNLGVHETAVPQASAEMAQTERGSVMTGGRYEAAAAVSEC